MEELTLTNQKLTLTADIEDIIRIKAVPIGNGAHTTCPNCLTLQSHIKELTEENTKLREENTELRSCLAAYENPHTPPSKHRYPTPQRRLLGDPRYPGRPRGHKGNTRPRPRPDVVKAPPWKENCKGYE